MSFLFSIERCCPTEYRAIQSINPIDYNSRNDRSSRSFGTRAPGPAELPLNRPRVSVLAVIENDSWLFAGGFSSVTVRSLDAAALAYGRAFPSEAPALVSR